MSTRYVWQRDNFQINSSIVTNPSQAVANRYGDVYYSAAIEYGDNGEIQLYSPTRDSFNSGTYYSPGISNVYFYVMTDSGERMPSQGVYFTSGQMTLHYRAGGSAGYIISANGTYPHYISYSQSRAGNVSNAASSTYPPQNYASKSARMCP